MAEITAGMVKALREKTDAPMMECKKALTEADGDLAKAEELLRVKLGSKASKAAGRVTAEGIVAAHVRSGELDNVGALVEINCETDFVAKNDDFLAFAQRVAEAIVRADPVERRGVVGAARPTTPTARPSTRSAPRWSARSARTSRSAASCATRRAASSRATCTARGSA